MPLTAEQIEKSRAEFEAECEPVFKNISGGGYEWNFREDDEYYFYGVNSGFKCWLARQETLCVELPIARFDYDCGHDIFEPCDVREAIEAAGIAHK